MAARNGAALRKRGVSAVECEADCHCHDSYKPSTHHKDLKLSQNVCTTAVRLALLLFLAAAVIHVSLSSHKHSTKSQSILPQKRARFPKYGSAEFVQQCNWTIPSSSDDQDPPCSILVRPPVRSNEGIADWASQITRAYMQARQVGCKVIFDYGLDVDIFDVLEPVPSDNQVHNWTVPSDVECNQQCQTSISSRFGDWSNRATPKPVPYYRHFFTFTFSHYYRGDFPHMPDVYPGFDIETGMACALGNLMNLSPKAAQFEPSLFTTILPALQDVNALVIALYMRTNRADVMAVNERKNESNPEEQKGKYNSTVESYAQMAQCLEEQYLTGKLEQGVDIQKVYWIVLSDSPEAKRTVVEGYSHQDANARISFEEQTFPSRVIPRQVLVTGARGIHVRAERNPNTAEFAEAFLDWYLIGESDVVVTDQASSFGPTGAMRTNRPIYRGLNCEQPLKLIHEESERPKKKQATS